MTYVLGLSGWARAGKDTVADYLVAEHGFVKLSFAAPMRTSLEALNPIVGLSRKLGGTTTMRLDSVIHEWGWDGYKESPYGDEMRALMQRFGTEVGRNIFGQNFWVDQAMKLAQQHNKVVFSDLRFKNEAQAVLDAGGDAWRITRTGVEAVNDHISEHDLDDFPFSTHINNDGDIEKLHTYIKDIINGK